MNIKLLKLCDSGKRSLTILDSARHGIGKKVGCETNGDGDMV